MITISAFADEIGPGLMQQMDVCESHGIRCIDVRNIDDTNVSKMKIAQIKQYRKQMADRGFRVPCIGSPLGKIRISDDFGVHMESLKHLCEVAREFGTNLIRVFSFYPTEGKNIADQRKEVMDRLFAMCQTAAKTGVVLMHENEKGIYGAKPTGVLDIFKTIQAPNLQGIYDPANYVEEDVAPFDDGWRKGLDKVTHFFHVKDKVPGTDTCVPAGQGRGQFAELFAELKKLNWSGYMTLEPHMSVAGQFSGYTGPENFAKAVSGLKATLDKAGLKYQ